jgi:tetratricopeptide (TPR) repeat protein
LDAPIGRYRAFISYSHKDSAWGTRIHRALETYRIPAKLVGTITARGAVPQRLAPIFRDREELSAGEDLSQQVRDALAVSDALIVLCSPHARASIWVAKEIETFRALYPDRPILAALIDGEPQDAFPAALTVDPKREPIAADFRKDKDGKRLARLKLIAGLTGVGLDALVQRDAQRQFRRVMAVTLGAAIAVLAMAALLVMALRAQAEAQRQRAEAEGLVEYMLTDLRDKLKGVGRLDVMTAVNERAMGYYGDTKSLDGLSDESLERRARVIGKMADDEDLAGTRASADKKYHELHRTTERLLAKSPDDPARAFAHAMSENRLALIAGERQNFEAALPRLRRAEQLLAQAATQFRNDPEWIRQKSYVSGNLCTALLSQSLNPTETVNHCRNAVAASKLLVSKAPQDGMRRYDLAFHLFWLSEVLEANGQSAEAQRTREETLLLVEELTQSDPKNMMWREQQMELSFKFARSLLSKRRFSDAQKMLATAQRASVMLTVTDRKNAYWADYSRKIDILTEEMKADERDL